MTIFLRAYYSFSFIFLAYFYYQLPTHIENLILNSISDRVCVPEHIHSLGSIFPWVVSRQVINYHWVRNLHPTFHTAGALALLQ